MVVRIYRPAKSAMTSGQGNAREWVLDFVAESARRADPLMGWTSTTDTRSQTRLRFETKEEAVAFAKKHGLPYHLSDPHPRAANIRPKGYGANFSSERRQAWTH